MSSLLGIKTGDADGSKSATTLDCPYVNPGSAKDTISMNFSTTTGQTPQTVEAALRAQGTSANFQKVPGLGDAAFYDTPNGKGSYIAVLSGPLAFHIVSGGVIPLANMRAMAAAILAS